MAVDTRREHDEKPSRGLMMPSILFVSTNQNQTISRDGHRLLTESKLANVCVSP